VGTWERWVMPGPAAFASTCCARATPGTEGRRAGLLKSKGSTQQRASSAPKNSDDPPVRQDASLSEGDGRPHLAHDAPARGVARERGAHELSSAEPVMTRAEVLVVDAGFSGATAPRILAEAGWRVYVIDRR